MEGMTAVLRRGYMPGAVRGITSTRADSFSIAAWTSATRRSRLPSARSCGPGSTSTFPTTLLTTTTQPRFYEVQPGDTLFDIAKAHGLPVEAIMQANGMTDANVLLAGQVIQLPLATEFTTTTLPRPTTIPPSTALPLVPTLAP